MNDLDLGGQPDATSALQVNNFIGEFEGNNHEITNICVGVPYYYGIDYIGNTTIKNITFRPSVQVNSNESGKEAVVIGGQTFSTLNNVHLSNVKIIPNPNIRMYSLLGFRSLSSSCTVTDFVFEGQIQRPVSCSATINRLKILRLGTPIYASSIPIFENFSGVMYDSQYIIKGYEVNINPISNFGIFVNSCYGTIKRCFVKGNITINYTDLASNYYFSIFGTVQSSNISDVYFEGNLTTNVDKQYTAQTTFNCGIFGVQTGTSYSTTRHIFNGNLITPVTTPFELFNPLSSNNSTTSSYKYFNTSKTLPQVKTFTNSVIGLDNDQFKVASNFPTFDFTNV